MIAPVAGAPVEELLLPPMATGGALVHHPAPLNDHVTASRHTRLEGLSDGCDSDGSSRRWRARLGASVASRRRATTNSDLG